MSDSARHADPSAVDEAYDQLQVEFKQLATSLQDLARKLQNALHEGDNSAREWLLDLKQIALDVRAEQVQVNQLLSEVHAYVANAHAQAPPLQSIYQQQIPVPAPASTGGLLRSRFAHAVEMGAGFAVGEDLINSIF